MTFWQGSLLFISFYSFKILKVVDQALPSDRTFLWLMHSGAYEYTNRNHAYSSRVCAQMSGACACTLHFEPVYTSVDKPL